MKKLISICIMFSLLSLTYFQVYGAHETATVVSHIYGVKGVEELEVTIRKETAITLEKDLTSLNEAIQNNDYDTAFKIVNKLKKDNIIPANTLYTLLENQLHTTHEASPTTNPYTRNLTNALCFILGYGQGLFAYPVDFIAIFLIVLLTGWLPLGIFLALIYSFFWVVFSHLLPVRSVLPITMFGMGNGTITTIGLNGVKTFTPDPTINQSSVLGLFVGFIGLVINIIIPPDDEGNAPAPFFVVGYSLAAFELEDSNNTVFNPHSISPLHQHNGQLCL